MLIAAAGTPEPAALTERAPRVAACQAAVIEGGVEAGQGFRRSVGNGLDVLLEPVAAGWVLRLLPIGGPRVYPDLAEIATPPYRSVSPLLLSTDFSFRAQDAVGWNPRRFQFAADLGAYRRMEPVFRRYIAAAHPSPELEGSLATAVSGSAEAELRILDARLIPGTADQTGAAALVATHFQQTAHQIVQEGAGPLGRILALRFRVVIPVAATMRHAPPGVRLEPRPCQAGSGAQGPRPAL